MLRVPGAAAVLRIGSANLARITRCRQSKFMGRRLPEMYMEVHRSRRGAW